MHSVTYLILIVNLYWETPKLHMITIYDLNDKRHTTVVRMFDSTTIDNLS